MTLPCVYGHWSEKVATLRSVFDSSDHQLRYRGTRFLKMSTLRGVFEGDIDDVSFFTRSGGTPTVGRC